MSKLEFYANFYIVVNFFREQLFNRFVSKPDILESCAFSRRLNGLLQVDGGALMLSKMSISKTLERKVVIMLP